MDLVDSSGDKLQVLKQLEQVVEIMSNRQQAETLTK